MDNLLIGLHINESKVAPYADVVYLGNFFTQEFQDNKQGIAAKLRDWIAIETVNCPSAPEP